MPTLSARDRRALLLGGLILGPALLWALVAAPYLRAVSYASERLIAERELLRREVELLATADEDPAALEVGAERLLEVAKRLVGGENPAVANAAHAQYLQTVARDSRVLITRMEPLAAEEAGIGLVALPLRVQGETDLEGLMTLLHSLEAGSKLVSVENLRIQGLRTAAAAGSADAEVLTFEFTTSGFMLVELDGPLPGAPVESEAGGAG